MSEKPTYEDLAKRIGELEKRADELGKTETELLKVRDELEQRVKHRTSELEQLYSRLLNAQEEERQRIAADLHDGIGQSLSAIKFMIENVLDQAESGHPDIGALKALVPMLQDASREVRTIVMNLRPSILDDLGINTTIGWFCRQFRTVYSTIDVRESIEINETEVSEELKIVIFRILQEAMNNIAKHGDASLVKVSLNRTGADMELAISDNGKGFDMTRTASGPLYQKGFGIPGMKERAELSGGTFEIVSGSGRGSTVRAVWKIGSPVCPSVIPVAI